MRREVKYPYVGSGIDGRLTNFFGELFFHSFTFNSLGNNWRPSRMALPASDAVRISPAGLLRTCLLKTANEGWKKISYTDDALTVYKRANLTVTPCTYF